MILCLVTDRQRFQAADRRAACDALVTQAAEAADAGIDIFQVREPDLDDLTLLDIVTRIRAAVDGSTTRVVVNDRVDVVLAAGAHGVHLRASSYPASRARTLLGDAALVGRSVHDVEEARAVEAGGGVDYLVFGTVFATTSKPADHPLAGLDTLGAAVRACRPLPVLAIGGVTLERAAQVATTGAAGIAGIGLFLGAQAPGARAADSLRAVAEQVRRAFAELAPR